jgi:ABC-type antimicrobial peptide transport system permease subunit
MANKLRSFFTLLGIIVSVAFLVAVVAVIQGWVRAQQDHRMLRKLRYPASRASTSSVSLPRRS